MHEAELKGEFGSNSIFADAPDDTDNEKGRSFGCLSGGVRSGGSRAAPLTHVRREIMELGLPDDFCFDG